MTVEQLKPLMQQLHLATKRVDDLCYELDKANGEFVQVWLALHELVEAEESKVVASDS